MSFSLSSAVFLEGGASIDLDGSLLIQLGIFFLAFALLRALVFRPLVALFDARDSAMEGAKREARALELDAEEKLKTFENEMKKVRSSAATDREALQKEAARLERELLAKARQEADATSGEATRTMQMEAAKIREEMKVRVPSLAREIATKLLGRNAA